MQSHVVEARARIMWGDAVSEVREELMGRGLSLTEIDTVILLCEQERVREVRNRGFRDLVIGITALILSVTAIVLQLLSGYIVSKLMIISLGAVFVGFWKSLEGTSTVLLASKISGSVTEL